MGAKVLSGFNRDIVECKGRKNPLASSYRDGFNRDIVECKGRLVTAIRCVNSDLIETLWNVKQIVGSRFGASGFRI